MAAAVELYLDPVAERRIRALWDALEEAGVPTLRDLTHGKHRPHVSLFGADRLDGPAVAAALAGLDAAPPLRVRLDHLGQFVGRVLWLGPVPTPELIGHHAAVHARLSAAGIVGNDNYRPGSWVPHCTLSMRAPRAAMPAALHRCLDVLPIEARVSGAAVADHARGQYTPLTV
ncbi:2'-5' RNA ligase family protein [Longispora sp. K20-0274]|uniref:2'-5' RNA ligase family protein n=1 Tax=Longispora sp. K20-0274 TaxID=3088255 RepID=UPI00399B8347